MSWLVLLSSAQRARAGSLALGLGVSIVVAPLAVAQSGPNWNGWARCQIVVSGPGYSDQQSHSWTLTGAPATTQGAMRIYPATWTDVGSGSLQRTQGSQSLDAKWTTSAQGLSAPIAVVVRASDGRLLIKSSHAQLHPRGAVTGTQQVTIDGKMQPPGTISLEAFEWSFPVIEDVATITRTSGTSTSPATGKVGPMQPANARGTVTCAWQFVRSGSTAPPPAPITSASTTPATIVYQPAMPSLQRSAASGAATTSASFTQRLSAVEAWFAGEMQVITVKLVQIVADALTRAAPDCTQLQTDVNAAYASLVLAIDSQYNQLLPAATTVADRNALASQKAADLVAVQKANAAAVAGAAMQCQ
jgi:hypothetical protein